MDSGWCKCNGGKQTELVNENYGKQSWTRREATAHEPQRRKNDDAKINESNVPPTHIIQLSGHCDTQSVNNYSSVSKE